MTELFSIIIGHMTAVTIAAKSRMVRMVTVTMEMQMFYGFQVREVLTMPPQIPTGTVMMRQGRLLRHNLCPLKTLIP